MGISYDGEKETITAKTRGRVATPFTEGKSPTTFLLETDFSLLNNLVQRINKKYPHLIEKCNKLLRVKDLASFYEELANEFNTIIALMFQGGDSGRSPVLHWEYKKKSILDTLIKNENSYIKGELNMINFSSYLFHLLLKTLHGDYTDLQTVLSQKKAGRLKTKLNFN